MACNRGHFYPSKTCMHNSSEPLNYFWTSEWPLNHRGGERSGNETRLSTLAMTFYAFKKRPELDDSPFFITWVNQHFYLTIVWRVSVFIAVVPMSILSLLNEYGVQTFNNLHAQTAAHQVIIFVEVPFLLCFSVDCFFSLLFRIQAVTFQTHQRSLQRWELQPTPLTYGTNVIDSIGYF